MKRKTTSTMHGIREQLLILKAHEARVANMARMARMTVVSVREPIGLVPKITQPSRPQLRPRLR